MRIKINKLFGKYDNEFDLDKNINLFIGENGIGKSTSIKILNRLFRANYVGLLDYYFDSIDLIDNDEKITIKYSDLTLSNKALIKDFIGDELYSLYEKIKEEFEKQKNNIEKEIGRDIDANDFESWVLKEVNDDLDTELVNSSLDFAVWYDYDLFLSNVNNRLLYKILKLDKKVLKTETLLKQFERSSDYINMIKETYSDYKRLYSEKDYLNNSKYNLISKKVNEFIKKLNFDNILFIDMVSNFNIVNDFKRLSIINDLEKNEITDSYDNKKIINQHWISSLPYEINEELSKIDDNFKQINLFDEPNQLLDKVSPESKLKKYKDIDFCMQLKNNYTVNYNTDYINEIYTSHIKEYVEQYDYDREIQTNVSNKFIDDFCKFIDTYYQSHSDEIVDFEYLLFNHIYINEKIDEFKNDFYDYLNEFANDEQTREYNISDKTYNIIKCYLRPLLNDDNVIAQALDKIFILDDKTKYLYKDEINFLGAFYSKFKNKYFAIEDKKLDLLNSLFKEYFNSKEVVATPFGIVISTKDYENDINFEELSTGEKKIIILFTLLTFSKNQIILLDEPEASLSVIWQENLIKDIVINFDFNRLIAATQSPYIVSCDEFIDNLVCLPMENENEQ